MKITIEDIDALPDEVYDTVAEMFADEMRRRGYDPESYSTVRWNLECELEEINAGDKDLKFFTVFCTYKSRVGTTWISSVRADNADQAWHRGREMCARDWELEDPSEVHVLGVAEGDVKILNWTD